MACGGCISWRSFLNGTICISTTQAETIGVSEAGRESEWLRILLGELQLDNRDPTKLWCDNQSTIEIIKKPVNFKGTKHIALRHLYAHELNELRRIEIQYCPTDEMMVDILTKPLDQKTFGKLREAMGVTKV